MSNRVIIDQTINTVTTDQCPDVHNSVVVNNDIPSIIDVTENVTNIVTVAVPGPQGPVGPQGPTGLGGDITGSEYYVAVFKSATGLFTGSLYQSASFTSIRNATAPEDPTNPDILYVNGDGIDTYNLISAHGNYNNYVQLNVQNYNNSTQASSDIVATANNGTEEEFYIDMGINSEGFTNVGNVGGANDAYVYSTGNDLYIGNASPGRQVIIFNGGLDAANNANVWIHDQGTVGINTGTYNTSNTPSLQIEALNSENYNVVQIYGETDNYSQVAITNRSGGPSASSDLALYNDLDPTNQLQGYVDLGINSSNYAYSGVYPGSAGDAYLFTDSHHLIIGSLSASADAKVTLFAGGINEAENAKLVLYGNNQHEMTGSLNATDGFTGSLYGTASWALNTATSSNILGGRNNYIPLWSGSSSLTSSIIYQNGSLLGINNPTPNRTLDLISLQSGSYVTVASFIAPNNNIVGNTTQFYLGAQQATGNSISWTFNYQGNNSVANRMGFEFNGYATPVLSMFRNGNSVFGGAIDNGFKHDVQGTGRYTNNLTVTGSVTATTGFTGSLFGTASWAENAITASYLIPGATASYAESASYAPNIYNSDGVISSNRIVDLNNKTLTFSNTSNVYYSSSAGVFLSLQASSNTAFISVNYYDSGSNLVGGWGYGNSNVISPVYRNKIYFAGVNVPYSIIMNSVETSRNYVNGNVKIQTGGTYVDNGYKLQVSAQSTSSGSLWVSGSSVITGSLTVTEGITGSLFGTSSWAENAITASYVPASGVVGLNLSQISSGSVSASVNTDISASFRITSGSNTLLNVTRDGFVWIGNGSFTNAGYQLDVLNGDARINGLTIGRGRGNIQSNTTFGNNAGSSTTSPNNTTIGNNAGANITSLGNTIVGSNAVQSGNLAGSSNSVFGFQTYLGGTGANNNYFGAYSAQIATGGSNNCGFGNESLRYLTGGSNNAAFGFQSLYSNTGNSNTSLGYYSGGTNTTGGNNIFIGYNSTGVSPIESNRTWIGNSSTTSTWLGGNLILGQTDDFGPRLQVTGNATITGSLTISQGITGSNALITGTITAQTLVVQTVSSSIVYSSGSNIFGNALSNTQQLTGSVTVTGSLSVNGSNVILTNQTASMTVLSASYALTASYVSGASSTSVTASYAFTSSYATSFIVSGTLNVGKTNIEFQENTNVTSGTWRVVSSEPTASYRAAFFDYVMFSGSIARAGTVYSVWSASYAEYYENYTGDVGGSTAGVTLQAAISGSNIQLQATASNNAWTIRSLVRML
jgi:hypothetical protein